MLWPLRKQLSQTLDDGVVHLDKRGARGVLFKVTLLRYSYTFVSKATTAGFIPELKHEADIYRHLLELQGICVPVFLKAVDLRELNRTYYYKSYESYETKVSIAHMVHFMFLSYSGSSLDEVEVPD
ncbi:uncharacterized protein DNG_04603 [Cephalotrichum gorgonifer]|uniref:Uncharacterized protein n=1 Tax=Cephalotrichum gorgonifer TaxID=2041049 RepID=A0AAE8MZ49_9PEZI|nr:uncharacterized protein DNG_04603 [Cephalotrichum gorgonifer]